MISNNTRKLRADKARSVSVKGAMHVVRENQMREEAERKREEEQRRQEKREKIAAEYPWIGEVLGVEVRNEVRKK